MIVLSFIDLSLILTCWILATNEISTGPVQALSDQVLPALPILIRELNEAVAGEEALSRPVFWSTRRPYIPTVREPGSSSEEEVSVEIAPLDHTLAGVFIGDGQPRALLRNADGKDQWLAKEEKINGWRLIAVSPGQVVLQDGDRRATLELYPPRISPKQ